MMTVHIAGTAYATLCAYAGDVEIDTARADCPDCCAIADVAPYVARYAAFNEYGGVRYTLTLPEIELRHGRNDWQHDYDSESDTFTVWQSGKSHTIHTLVRVN